MEKDLKYFINKINEFLPDEHHDMMKYAEFIQDLHVYLRQDKISPCVNEEFEESLNELTRLPREEADHYNILNELKCGLERL